MKGMDRIDLGIELHNALRLAPNELEAHWVPPVRYPITATFEGVTSPRDPAPPSGKRWVQNSAAPGVRPVSEAYIDPDEWIVPDELPPQRTSSPWIVDGVWSWWLPPSRVTVDWHGQEAEVLDAARLALGLEPDAQLSMVLESAMVFDAGGALGSSSFSHEEPDQVATMLVDLGREPGQSSVVLSTSDFSLYHLEQRVARCSRNGREVLVYQLLLDGADDPIARREGQIEEAAEVLRRWVPLQGYKALDQRDGTFVLTLGNHYELSDLHDFLGGLRGGDLVRAALLLSAAKRVGCDVTPVWLDQVEFRTGFPRFDEVIQSFGIYPDFIPELRIRLLDYDGWVRYYVNFSYDEEYGWLRESHQLDDQTVLLSPISRDVVPLGERRISHDWANVWENLRQLPALIVGPSAPSFADLMRDDPERKFRETAEKLERLEQTARDTHSWTEFSAERVSTLIALEGMLPAALTQEELRRGKSILYVLDRHNGWPDAEWRTTRAPLARDVLKVVRILKDDVLTDELVRYFDLPDLTSVSLASFLDLVRVRGAEWAERVIVEWWNESEHPRFADEPVWHRWLARLPNLVTTIGDEVQISRLVLREVYEMLLEDLQDLKIEIAFADEEDWTWGGVVYDYAMGLAEPLRDYGRALTRAPEEVIKPLLDELCEVLSWPSSADPAIRVARTTRGWHSQERDSEVARRLREVALEHLERRTDPQARTIEVKLRGRC